MFQFPLAETSSITEQFEFEEKVEKNNFIMFRIIWCLEGPHTLGA